LDDPRRRRRPPRPAGRPEQGLPPADHRHRRPGVPRPAGQGGTRQLPGARRGVPVARSRPGPPSARRPRGRARGPGAGGRRGGRAGDDRPCPGGRRVPQEDGDVINGILFDLDGTLLDHRTAADTAIGAWVSERAPGHPRLGEAAALCAALEEPHLAAWHAGECSGEEQRRRRLRALCAELAIEPPADLDAAFAELTGHYPRGRTVFADPAAALAALDGFRIGALTNGAKEIQEEKVPAIGLEGRVRRVLTGEVLGGCYKPAEACYTAAAAALGLPPREVLLV